ncbi:unnamed protein product [Prorocentrum cordatum]|uniref:Uncharacterized protein n=1 Tax=Prorocentrum cordatum TaxID=2364126 RepID=A0ABN9WQ66_9DINO|nr:unnamed protein product [Polarella glacialis]
MVAQTRRAADDMGPLRRTCRKLARDLVVMEPARPAGPERAAPEATPVQAKGLLQHIQESTADAARERAQPAKILCDGAPGGAVGTRGGGPRGPIAE